MRASQIRVSALGTYNQCYEAIKDIENDFRNTVGGHKAWVSGYQTYLTATAKKKIAQIDARIERLFGEPDDE